jgi:hypothetical protein
MSNIPSRKIPSNYQISSLLLIATVPPIAITAAKHGQNLNPKDVGANLAMTKSWRETKPTSISSG